MVLYILMHIFLLFSLQISALPLHVRLAEPTPVTTVQTIDSATGPVTQTCGFTLTNEAGAVQEVKTCTDSMVKPDPASPTAPDSVATPIPIPTRAPSPAIPVPFSPAAVPVPPASPASIPVPSPSVPTSASSVPASVAPSSTPVEGASSIHTSVALTSTGPQSNAAFNSSTLPSGSAAADRQSATSAAFTLPGKKLSVLPIGLGIFAGVSAIALIVVGLVTYERTKYRRAFRQRKLAEAGANMV